MQSLAFFGGTLFEVRLLTTLPNTALQQCCTIRAKELAGLSVYSYVIYYTVMRKYEQGWNNERET